MTETHFNSEATTDFPLHDIESIIDDVAENPEVEAGGKVSSSGAARRSLEERREAQHLRRLLSDYAWDEQEF